MTPMTCLIGNNIITLIHIPYLITFQCQFNIDRFSTYIYLYASECTYVYTCMHRYMLVHTCISPRRIYVIYFFSHLNLSNAMLDKLAFYDVLCKYQSP